VSTAVRRSALAANASASATDGEWRSGGSVNSKSGRTERSTCSQAS
jgi:hypothetical protein